MTKQERYNRYLTEAKRRIAQLALEIAEQVSNGLDASSLVDSSCALQDSIDFLESDFNDVSDKDIMRIVDYYVTIEKLVVNGLLPEPPQPSV